MFKAGGKGADKRRITNRQALLHVYFLQKQGAVEDLNHEHIHLDTLITQRCEVGLRERKTFHLPSSLLTAVMWD